MYSYTPKAFTILGDNIVCQGDEVSLYADGDIDEIVWTQYPDTTVVVSDGRALLVAPLSDATYQVQGRNCGHYVKDTITIRVKNRTPVNLGNDTTICKGDVARLDAGEGYVKYTWHNSSESRYFEAWEEGEYSVVAEQANGCLSSHSIVIKTTDIPKIQLGNDRILCGSPIPLSITGDAATYNWSTGSTASTVNVAEPGTYWATAENQCGVSTEFVTVYSFGNIFIPNVLTLNGDEFNEKLMVKGIGDLTGNMKVFNKWGMTVFEKNNYYGEWPSQSNNLSSGMYYYLFTVPGCKSIKGWLNVLKEN